MKPSRLASLTAIVTLAVSTTLFAGFRLTVPVTVSATSFSGSYGGARNSADGNQYLFCRDDGGSAFCGARDAAGTAKSCTTTNVNHLNVIRSMVDDSRVDITFNASGVCTSVSQVNGSYYDVKAH